MLGGKHDYPLLHNLLLEIRRQHVGRQGTPKRRWESKHIFEEALYSDLPSVQDTYTIQQDTVSQLIDGAVYFSLPYLFHGLYFDQLEILSCDWVSRGC